MRIIIVCICAIKRKGDLFNARAWGSVSREPQNGSARDGSDQGDRFPLPILVGGGKASGAGLLRFRRGGVVSRGRRNRFVLR